MLNQTVTIIRSYNNAAVMKQVKALRSFLPYIIVVTDGVQDKGATRAWLQELNDPCIHIIEMMSGYTWSNALNRGLQHIKYLNVDRTHPFQFILNVSVEAQFKEADIKEMLSEFSDVQVGVVGTSFRGFQEGNEISLGRSYRHPRNTGMIIRLEMFSQPMMQMGFDSFCDDTGGMEDIDFIYRMKIFSEMQTVMLDRQVRLIVGRHYNQKQKEAREREAMEKIFARYQKWSHRLTDMISKWHLTED